MTGRYGHLRLRALLRPKRLDRPTRRGRVLAVKLGLNPNSSSLGVDVTFLLFGAAALSVMTPLVSAMVRIARHDNSSTPHQPHRDPKEHAAQPGKPRA